jgi:hypothetical protein
MGRGWGGEAAQRSGKGDSGGWIKVGVLTRWRPGHMVDLVRKKRKSSEEED